MRLLGLYINNYGLLNDFSLTEKELAGSLSIIYGLNEAGKSTLLSFIRGVLFGFKSEGHAPAPVIGGEAGGYLILEDNGEVYRVERSGKGNGVAAVELPGGGRAGEEVLKARLLRGLSPVLFKNVFAFGMEELRRLEDLSRDEISAYIYGAGTGTSPRKLTDAVSSLEKAAGELFKIRGRAPRLNKLVFELEELDRNIRQLEQQPARYIKLQEEQQKKELERERLRSMLSDRQARIRRLEYLIKARAPWNELRQCFSQMAQLPAIDSFPEEGLARLGELEARLDAKKEEVMGWSAKGRAIEQQIALINVEEEIIAAAFAINELSREKALYLEKKQQLSELDIRIAELGKTARDRLAVLGSGWDESRVMALDTSPAARRLADDFAAGFGRLEQKEAITKSRLEGCRKEFYRYRTEKAELVEALNDLPKDSSQNISLDELLGLADQAAIELERFKHVDQMKEMQQERLKELDQSLEQKYVLLHRAGKRSTLAWAVAASFIVTCLGAWLYYSEFAYGLWVSGFGLVCTLLTGSVQWAQSKKNKESIDKLSLEVRELTNARGKIEKARDRLEQEIINSTEKLNRAAKALKGGGVLTGEEIPALRHKFIKERESRRVRAEVTAKLKQAESELATAERELIQAENEHRETTEKLRQLQQKWEQWLADKGLTGLSPSGAMDYLSFAEKAADEIKRIRLEQQAADQIRQYVTGYENRVNELAASLGRGFVTRDEVAGRVTRMSDYLEEQQQAQAELEKHRGELASVQSGKKLAEEGLSLVRRKISELLNLGGASDEEDFRYRAAVYRERKELKRRMEDLRGQLLNIAGSAAELAELEDELERTRKSDHEEEYHRLKELLETAEHKFTALGDELAAVKQEMKALESGEELARARQKREMLRQSLAAGARDWQVNVLCSALLDMAREKHERERQPAVLAHASKLLQPMTQNRYSRVVAPVGSTSSLEVEEPGGRRVGAHLLSRGAASQLYLAVRLALACHFCTSVTPMPIILDDIMVDFDGPRLRGALQVLEHLAGEHQLILFTCHKHVIETAREQLSGANIIYMDGRKKAPSK